MKVERVKYVIWAVDPKRAVRFYRDVLGGDVVKESEVISEVVVNGATTVSTAAEKGSGLGRG